jgi:hypothetical protein
MISHQKAAFIRSLADAAGNIEPAVVIEAARPPDSPIHDDFEWDVQTAASQHWLEQARTLIRYVRLQVQIERQTIVAPFYVPDPNRAPKSKTYMTLTTAVGKRDLALRILDSELERITAAVERARAVALVLGVDDDLNSMLASVSSIGVKAARGGPKKGGGKGKGGGRKGPRSQVLALAAE